MTGNVDVATSSRIEGEGGASACPQPKRGPTGTALEAAGDIEFNAVYLFR